MLIDAGRFRHIVTIERNTGTVPDGHGELRPKWTPLYPNIPAEVRPVSSRELWSGQAVKVQNTHRVYLRWAPGINTDCRVVFKDIQDRTFTISGVIDHDERHILLELMCVEQVD